MQDKGFDFPQTLCLNEVMNILITAGGTSEPIDEVRTITNSATGRLGSLVADACAAREEFAKIFYVCGQQALRPVSEKVTVCPILGTLDLQETCTKILKEEKIDAIVHSMAVSDYLVESVTTLSELAKVLSAGAEGEEELHRLFNEAALKDFHKLSSSLKSPVLLLKQTPKVLSGFRALAPEAQIIGFKLLSQVSEEELFDVASALLKKNDCNYVLANDGAKIHGDSHPAMLIDREGQVRHYTTKQEIAAGIVETLLEGKK